MTKPSRPAHATVPGAPPAPARVARLARAAAVLLALGAAGRAGAATPTPTGPLAIASQGSFFVGGREVHSDALSLLPAYASTGTITVDQMYVHYQVPADAAPATRPRSR